MQAEPKKPRVKVVFQTFGIFVIIYMFRVRFIYLLPSFFSLLLLWLRVMARVNLKTEIPSCTKGARVMSISQWAMTCPPCRLLAPFPSPCVIRVALEEPLYKPDPAHPWHQSSRAHCSGMVSVCMGRGGRGVD